MKLVSIIVPIYNNENYIVRCVKSIMQQTYHNLEIILINDGSSDRSEEICKDLQKSDFRIKYYYQENAGPSAARNLGLKMATGDFISFVDSDDYIEKNFIENMIKSADVNVDIVISGYKIVRIKNRKLLLEEKIPNIGPIYGMSDIKNHFKYLYYNGYFNILWNKLYIGDIIRDKNLSFDTEHHLGEDFLFNLNYFSHISSISFNKSSLYIYDFRNENSISSNYIENYLQKRLYILRELNNFFSENHDMVDYYKGRIIKSTITNEFRKNSKKLKQNLNSVFKDPRYIELLSSFENSRKDKLFKFLIESKFTTTIIWIYKIKYKITGHYY